MPEHEMKQVMAEIPSEDKEMLDEILAHGELTELIREVVSSVVEGEGFNRRTVYDARIKQVTRKITDTRDEINRLHRELERLENTRDTLQQEREGVLTKAEEWEAAFGEVERAFRAGDLGHLDPGHQRIKDIARRFGKTPDAVHEELRDRNPDVPDHAFKQTMFVERRFGGLPESQVGLPVEERRSA